MNDKTKEIIKMCEKKKCCYCGMPIYDKEELYFCEDCLEEMETDKKKEAKRKKTADHLRNYLKENCLGKENAVFSRDLEDQFLISGRDLRRVISALREKGEPICSDFHHGYYYAKNPDEIKKTVKGLNEHVTGVSNTIMDLRNAELKKECEMPIIGTIVIMISPSEGPEEELVMQLL